jgi:hypothetical protein
MYLLVRALDVAVRHAWQAFALPTVPHVDAAIFILSCFEIMHAWFYHPTTIPSIYASWITRMAKMDVHLLELLRQVRDGRLEYGVRSDFNLQYCGRWGADPVAADFLTYPIPCAIVHPLDPGSCTANVARRWTNGFGPSLAIYTPVHLLPVLFLNFSSIMRNPFQTLARVAGKILQSAAFLSSFIALVWAGVCICRNGVRDRLEYAGPLLGSAACGFSVFIERKPRRIELALKVLPDAMISVWRRAVQRGWVGDIPFSDVAIFSMALGMLSYFYYEAPDSMKPSIRGFFSWCFE